MDERKIGEWLDVEVVDIRDGTPVGPTDIASMLCSCCGRYHNEVYFYGDPVESAHYCPWCGADMRRRSV